MSGELDHSMKWDRRRQPRKIPQSFTFLQLEHDEGGRVVNLSEEGLCFESFSPIRTVNPVPLWFSFNLRDRIEATGQVVWSDSRKEVGGIAFINLSPAARQLIRAHIEHAPAEQMPEAAEASGAVARAAVANEGVVRTSASSEQAVRAGSSTLARGAGLVVVPQVPQVAQVPHVPRLGELRFAESQAAGAPESPASGLGLPELSDSPDQAPLVPLERFVAATRSQFLRGLFLGLLLGIVITTLILIPIFKYALRSRPTANGREVSAPSSPANTGFNADPSGGQSPVVQATPVTTPATPSKPPSAKPISDSLGSPAPPAPRKDSRDVPRSDTFHNDPPHALSNTADRSKQNPLTPDQLWEAVQAGNSKAAVALADLYLRGDGVPMNCAQARILLQFAAQKSNAEGARRARELEKSGCPTP